MFTYSFQLADGRILKYEIDPERAADPARDQGEHPYWTRLGNHQCPACPLSTQDTRHCPVALDIAPVVEDFADISSVEQAIVSVTAPNRTYSRKCDVQVGLNSMLGLLMATSGCPLLGRLRHLANFHLPFASTEESLFRIVGGYLIQQYFIFKDGGTPDLDLQKLDAFYQDLSDVNTAFADRIREAIRNDAGANAVVLFWSMSYLVKFSLAEQMEQERRIFAPDSVLK